MPDHQPLSKPGDGLEFRQQRTALTGLIFLPENLLAMIPTGPFEGRKISRQKNGRAWWSAEAHVSRITHHAVTHDA
jgi:hypothetical protein